MVHRLTDNILEFHTYNDFGDSAKSLQASLSYSLLACGGALGNACVHLLLCVINWYIFPFVRNLKVVKKKKTTEKKVYIKRMC